MIAACGLARRSATRSPSCQRRSTRFPSMRLSIRSQLLLPLLTLMVGVVAMSTWTALASAGRARHQIETQMDAVAAEVVKVSFPRTPQILELMRGLSGAEFILCDGHRK